jgi:hypothetical protein
MIPLEVVNTRKLHDGQEEVKDTHMVILDNDKGTNNLK